MNNDVQIKKKVVSKLGKYKTYSSSTWSNSPGYVGFETLHQLLEGMIKKNFHQIYKTYFNFSRFVSKYPGIFPQSWGQTIA